MKRCCITVGFFLVFFSLAQASPITLFNSLGDSVDYLSPIVNPPYYTGVYASFSTLNSEFLLNDVTVTLADTTTAGSGVFTVGLYADSSTTPGALLDTIATVDDNSITTTPTQYSYSTNIDLNADTRYWVGVVSTSSSVVAGWDLTLNPSGPEVLTEYNGFPGASYSNSAWDYSMLMETTGYDVPEPSSILQGLNGLAALIFLRRRVTA